MINILNYNNINKTYLNVNIIKWNQLALLLFYYG